MRFSSSSLSKVGVTMPGSGKFMPLHSWRMKAIGSWVDSLLMSFSSRGLFAVCASMVAEKSPDGRAGKRP
jgi:hypothetical protein